MEMNILLSLLMTFGIFFQGSESLSERNIVPSSDHHVRQKRIIDTSHNRDEGVLRQNVPYVVLLINQKGNIHCTGSILSARIILTAAHCVFENKVFIITGGRLVKSVKIHNVLQIFIHRTFDMAMMKNDLALVIIKEPIDLINSFHRSIELYEGNLPPNSLGLVTGWGCTSRTPGEYPSQPLSIVVPIISQKQCQDVFQNSFKITSREICIHSVNRTKSCWHADSGAPLVVDGHLVGVFSSFHRGANPEIPDIFMNLLDPDYKRWLINWTNYYQRYFHI